MKFRFEKRTVLRYLSFFLCISLAIILFVLLRSFLPGAVSYSVSEENTHKAQIANAVSQNQDDSCLYNNISDIKNSGPFTVKSDGDEIYILFENEKLYRIKAKLSDFPSVDRQAIEKGIDAGDKRELFEIVSYMES